MPWLGSETAGEVGTNGEADVGDEQESVGRNGNGNDGGSGSSDPPDIKGK